MKLFKAPFLLILSLYLICGFTFNNQNFDINTFSTTYSCKNSNGMIEYLEVSYPLGFKYYSSKNRSKITLKILGGDQMTNTYKVSFPNDKNVYFLQILDNEIICTNPNGTSQTFITSNVNEIISIGRFAKEVKLKLGQKAKVFMDSHASVGIGSSVHSNNHFVVKLIDKKFKYDNPEESDLSGGDGGTTIYIFQAMTKGSATLHIRKEFRGKIEHKQEVNIIVE